jgi:Holliday junction resolvasome RuvABC endonuclease subunit
MSNTRVDGGLLAGPSCEVVLGMDPSLTGFGLTAICPDTWRFESWLYRSKQRGVERLRDIRDWLNVTLSDLVNNDFVILDAAVEDTVLASYSATTMGELSGMVRMFCAESLEGSAQYPMKVPPTVVKKYATDRGNAKKAEVLLAVFKKWGVEFRDDNLADSYVLARICAQSAETAYEAQVLAKLTEPRFRDPARV